MLKINNVTKRYSNGVLANEGIDIEIEDGQIYGFIGPNGAGKSTLIKSLVGIHSFDSGSITLDGLSLKDDELTYKSKIAYIPDNPLMYENLTAISYLKFIADVFNIDDAEKNIIELATNFEIKDALGDYIRNYSHGMKQKLAIISALIHKPKLLVLDEPFVGLDPKSSFKLKEIMKEFVKEGNIIFFSSHVLEVVEKLCDNIGIINKGKLIYNGNIEDMDNESLENFFLQVTENE